MQSPEIDKLAQSLAKAQGQIKSAVKDKVGQVGNQKTKYADLDACWEVARLPLSLNGLAVAQPTAICQATGDTILITKLLHSSGQWLAGEMKVAPTRSDPQAQGSALTYARRQAFCGIVGITQTDDDGQAATNAPAAQSIKTELLPEEKTAGDLFLDQLLMHAAAVHVPNKFVGTYFNSLKLPTKKPPGVWLTQPIFEQAVLDLDAVAQILAAKLQANYSNPSDADVKAAFVEVFNAKKAVVNSDNSDASGDTATSPEPAEPTSTEAPKSEEGVASSNVAGA